MGSYNGLTIVTIAHLLEMFENVDISASKRSSFCGFSGSGLTTFAAVWKI